MVKVHAIYYRTKDTVFEEHPSDNGYYQLHSMKHFYHCLETFVSTICIFLFRLIMFFHISLHRMPMHIRHHSVGNHWSSRVNHHSSDTGRSLAAQKAR